MLEQPLKQPPARLQTPSALTAHKPNQLALPNCEVTVITQCMMPGGELVAQAPVVHAPKILSKHDATLLILNKHVNEQCLQISEHRDTCIRLSQELRQEERPSAQGDGRHTNSFSEGGD